MEEKRDSFSSYFVTLTYKDEFLIYGDDGATGCVIEHQNFIKWLKYFEKHTAIDENHPISLEEYQRSLNNAPQEKKELRYYAVWEYGDQFGRPHLHYILFNVRNKHNITSAWSEILRLPKGNKCKQKYLPGRSKGKVDIDECNVNTIDYVLKYMLKVPREDGEYENKIKEVSYMSKGLGKGVVDDEFIRYIKRPEGNTVVNTRGTKVSLPRFYKKKYLTEKERAAKGEYIRKEVDKKNSKVDDFYRREGLDISKIEVNRKESKFNQLKNRRRRELKER